MLKDNKGTSGLIGRVIQKSPANLPARPTRGQWEALRWVDCITRQRQQGISGLGTEEKKRRHDRNEKHIRHRCVGEDAIVATGVPGEERFWTVDGYQIE